MNTFSKKEFLEEPLGEFKVCFGGEEKSLSEVFGQQPITYTEMQERLWRYIKEKDLRRDMDGQPYPDRKNT